MGIGGGKGNFLFTLLYQLSVHYSHNLKRRTVNFKRITRNLKGEKYLQWRGSPHTWVSRLVHPFLQGGLRAPQPGPWECPWPSAGTTPASSLIWGLLLFQSSQQIPVLNHIRLYFPGSCLLSNQLTQARKSNSTTGFSSL